MPIAATPAAPARLPVAPVPPVAPTPALGRSTSPPGQQKRLTFRVQRLYQPLQLEQVVRDPTYDRFRTWTMFIAIISVFLIFGALMFVVGVMGGFNVGSSTTTNPASTAIVPQSATPVAPSVSAPVQQNVAPSVQQPQWGSYADCQRHYVLTIGQDPEGACDSLK